MTINYYNRLQKEGGNLGEFLAGQAEVSRDNGRTPTVVIEHSVGIDPGIQYSGARSQGITVINEIQRRGRI